MLSDKAKTSTRQLSQLKLLVLEFQNNKFIISGVSMLGTYWPLKVRTAIALKHKDLIAHWCCVTPYENGILCYTAVKNQNWQMYPFSSLQFILCSSDPVCDLLYASHLIMHGVFLYIIIIIIIIIIILFAGYLQLCTW